MAIYKNHRKKSNRSYKSEDAIQSECYVWFNNTYRDLRGCLFAVPNGGARGALEGKILKMTGVYKGVSDMILLYNATAYLIEMKNQFGEQSPEQKEWQEKMDAQGFEYVVLRNIDEFKGFIKSIIPDHESYE